MLRLYGIDHPRNIELDHVVDLVIGVLQDREVSVEEGAWILAVARNRINRSKVGDLIYPEKTSTA